VDGNQRGVSPVTITELRSGGHQIKATKEGFNDFSRERKRSPYLKDRDMAVLVGLGMVPRGDLTLALAQSAIVSGIISQQIYTATVLLVLVTVLLTPFFIKVGLNRMNNGRKKTGDRVSGTVVTDDGQ
jgi:hypothetical protein